MDTKKQPKASVSIPDLASTFQDLLPREVVANAVRTSGRRFYERLFPPLLMVWCFVYQRLSADHTCDNVLSYLQSGAADRVVPDGHGRPLSKRIRSQNSAGYCKARQRLPLAVLEDASRYVAARVSDRLGEDGRWLGHPVALLDGSTLQLTPEPSVVAHYGRPKGGRGTGYWACMRIVAAFCLASGALLALAEGSYHTSEQVLAQSLLATALADTVYVADRNFGVLQIAAAVQRRGGWVVLRLVQYRSQVLLRHPLRSGDDCPVCWRASAYERRRYPELAQVAIPGRLIYVRLARAGFRPVDLYLFTTLLDAQRYPLAELVKLYGWRWQVELNLREVKVALDVRRLTAKSVEMLRKELYAALLAYNLIRSGMASAAHQSARSPLTLSFAQCARRLRDAWLYQAHPDEPRSEPSEPSTINAWHRLADCRLPKRPPNRLEPRAIRHRSSAYPFLRASRDLARQALRQPTQPAALKC